MAEKSPSPLCSICNVYPTNHACSFNITPNKKCGIPVCSMCKIDKMHIYECKPHRCQQHAPVGSGSTYKKSGSTLATCSSTLATSSCANVSGKDLLMATTNQPISSSSALDTLGRSEPKFIVHQGPLAPKSHKTFGHLTQLSIQT
jgi:hypothetical protein